MSRRKKDNQNYNNQYYGNNQYYDQNNQYYNQNGQYYSQNGQYYNQNSQYYNQNGQYYNQNGQYYNGQQYYDQNQYQQYNQNYNYQQQGNNKNNENKDKFKFDKKKIIIIICSILAVIALSLGIFFAVKLLSKNNSNDDNNKTDDIIEEVDTRRIGDSTLGYLTIPSEWLKFTDINGVSGIQYADKDGTYIVTLDAIETTEIDAKTFATAKAYQIEELGVTDINGTIITLNNYETYHVTGYFAEDNIWLYVWCFEAEDGYTHYIGIEGPDKDSEYFSIAETFSLKK